MSPVNLFSLSHGAAWILPDGRVIKIPGFHESWLASHPAIAGGATNTAAFVQKSGWLSAVLHDQGYLEIIVRSLGEEKIRECLWQTLAGNREFLSRVVIMALGVDGCLIVQRGECGTREEFMELLDSGPKA